LDRNKFHISIQALSFDAKIATLHINIFYLQPSQSNNKFDMKQCILTLFLTLFLIQYSFAQNDYFFPKDLTFNKGIPTPQQFLGYKIGDWHTRHDRMVSYFEKLAELSELATIQTIGHSNEHRPQVVLTITSKNNHTNLEAIRTKHLSLAEGTIPKGGFANMPVVVLLGFNVHGNEPSGMEAALLSAYYLLAANFEGRKEAMENAVFMIDPTYNPDGRDRHSNWVNMHKGFPPVADGMDREHNEVWPRGRTNHYWFDLNRDWLPLAQVESQNRMAFYHKWLPNVATDFHEMGTNATYFFEPTKPYGSENPIVGRRNYDELNVIFAKYFQNALDEIGSLYYTKESFDNSYPGYGSTYPDMMGGLGLLFEQASSRGHLQHTQTKDISFAFTIRNQLRSSIATIQASVDNRELLLKYQADFFKEGYQKANQSRTKAYIFGDEYDYNRTRLFAKYLQKHHVKVHHLDEDKTVNGITFKKGQAFFVPNNQMQYRMVQTIFEPVKEFYDSVFYDASAWTVALAYDMPYARMGTSKLGAEVTMHDLSPKRRNVQKAKYAYLFDWSDYSAPKALNYLQENGVFTKVAAKPFTIEKDGQKRNFHYGTILISVADQELTEEELHKKVLRASQIANIEIISISTGLNLAGPDLGSPNFATLSPPKIAMLLGDGVSGYEAGEVWHLLDTKLNMPISKVDILNFGRMNLNDYTTLILVSGSYRNFSENQILQIRKWTESGGTLITLRQGTNWVIREGIAKETFKKPSSNGIKKETRFDFETARNRSGAKAIGGSVYLTNLDITHPLGFGYHRRTLPVYRNHSIFVEPSKNAFSTVAKYTDNPHLDGYLHPDNLEMIKNSASLLVSRIGSGRAILFVDNPNFRGFWYGTNRLFFNALFFGEHVRVP
jgi:hypothetical protein